MRLQERGEHPDGDSHGKRDEHRVSETLLQQGGIPGSWCGPRAASLVRLRRSSACADELIAADECVQSGVSTEAISASPTGWGLCIRRNVTPTRTSDGTLSPCQQSGRPRACHLGTLRRILAEAASAVIYLAVGLVVLIVVLVIERARRGDPKARRTGGQADDGGGDGGGS